MRCVEVSETDKEIKVAAELPGLAEKDVHVELAKGLLGIGGEKNTENRGQGSAVQRACYGRFERRIAVEACG
jgi:HSP20 family protein